MENSAALLRRLNPYCARALGEGDLTVLARRYEWDMGSMWQALLSWSEDEGIALTFNELAPEPFGG